MKRIKFFASILLMLCLSAVCCAQTKIDWKQIKNIPKHIEFEDLTINHLIFNGAYQPVMDSPYKGAIYYDNQLNYFRVYENGNWRNMSVTIASDSIGAPLTILGYLQATDLYASQSAYIKGNIYASSSMYLKNNIYASGSAYLKNNIYASGSAYLAGGVNASGTSTLNRLKVNTSLKIPLTADSTLGVGSVCYDTATNKLKVLNSSNVWEEVVTDMAVDSAMSSTSTNPVQNKVIYSFLTDGTSSLNVKNIKATNATATNKLYAYDFVATHTLVLPPYYVDGDIHSLYGNTAALSFDNSDKKAKYVFAPVGGGTGYKILSTEDNTVSNITTGTADGTISVTKDSVTSDVAVKGLGSAAYANVASFSPQITIDSAISDSSTNPVENSVVKSYVDTAIATALANSGKATITKISHTNSNESFSYDIPSGVKYYIIFMTKLYTNSTSASTGYGTGIGGVYINGTSYLPVCYSSTSSNTSISMWQAGTVPWTLTGSSISLNSGAQHTLFEAFLVCFY